MYAIRSYYGQTQFGKSAAKRIQVAHMNALEHRPKQPALPQAGQTSSPGNRVKIEDSVKGEVSGRSDQLDDEFERY